MAEGDTRTPTVPELARKLLLTGFSALHNRGELLQVELQEEKNRVIELFIWAGAVCILGMMFLLVLTATVVLLFREDLRIYVAGGFSLLYLTGTVLALLNLKAHVKTASLPLAGTMA